MRREERSSFALIVVVIGVLCASGCASRATRGEGPEVLPVVAVTTFENKSGFAGQWQLGSDMADLLVSELVRSSRFVVVERQHFQGLVNEIARQQQTLFRPEGRIASGRMKGAQYMIRGVINDFSQSGGGSLSVLAKRIAFLGRAHVARVSLTLTLVAIETGEIASSVQSEGAVRTGEAYVAARYKGVAFGGELFFKTPLGAATREAIESGVRQIHEALPTTPWRPMIAEIADGKIIVNGGANHGFREGTLFSVRRSARPITDPATGDVISVLPGTRVGTIRIDHVREKIAFASIVDGEGFERGQWLSREEPESPTRR